MPPPPDHHPPHAADARRLGWAFGITVTFMVLEVAGGLLSGSLALLADAGHMLTDTAALALAWYAARLSQRSAAARGRRTQLRAALANALALLAVVAWIAWEAVQRLIEPRPVVAGTMLGVAVLGLLANLAVLRVLGRGHDANLNVAAARLHVLGDLLGSIAATAAAVVILSTGWTPVDPLLSLLVAALILRSAATLAAQSGRALLAPAVATEAPEPPGPALDEPR